MRYSFMFSIVLAAVLVAGCVGQTPVTSGNLSAASVLPVWKELTFGTAPLAITGGTQPYICLLKAGSVMPNGFTLSNDCRISGTAPMLDGGTTTRITPPFMVMVNDSAVPASSVELELRITIEKQSVVLTTQAAQCTVNRACNAPVVLNVEGGPTQYHYTGSTSSAGMYPLGLSVVNPGVLSGTSKQTGTYAIYVCVINSVGSSDCDDVQVTVVAEEQPPIVPPVVVIPNQTLDIVVRHRERGTDSAVKRGYVTIDPSNSMWKSYDCDDQCTYDFPENMSVTLTAVPEDGSMFGGWEGDCSGTNPTCTVKMSGYIAVDATFAAETATYHGTFSASGTFSRDFSSYSTRCYWYNTFSGTFDTVVIDNPDGTVRGWTITDGQYVSTASSGGNAQFTCLDSQLSWDDEDTFSGSKNAIRWTTAFTTSGGTTFTGEITANLPMWNEEMTGGISITSNTDTGGGLASANFVLTPINIQP